MSLRKNSKTNILSIRRGNIRVMDIRHKNIEDTDIGHEDVKDTDIRHENDKTQKRKKAVFRISYRGMTRCTCQKAVLTVEAAAVLPFFVCFMVFILYFFRILQVHAGVAQALQYAGRRTAAECSIETVQEDDKEKKIDFTALDTNSGENVDLDSRYEKTTGSLQDQGENGYEKITGSLQDQDESSFGISLTKMLKAKLYFTKQLKRQNCPLQYINHGIAGISLMQSDFSGNYVELKAVYRMRLPVAMLGNIQFQIVQEAKCRKWTGYQTGQDEKEDDGWLYYTEHGTVYHASRGCTYLDLSIRGVTYAQAAAARNKSGGKYHKCERCGNAGPGHGMVYITNYGDRYHSSLTCSGIKRSVYMIRKSEAVDKKMCSKCGK